MEKEILSGLLQINAIKLNFVTPFVWTSGIKSPIYCDNRLSIGDYELRHKIALALTKLIQDNYPEVELIGACATAGIPHGTSVADTLKLPLIYYRSKPKGHGTNSLIEGQFSSGQKVVIVEDLISTAKSVGQAIEESQKVGLNVIGVVSIVNYQLPEAKKRLKNLKVNYQSILSFTELEQYLTLGEVERQKLNEFFKDPINHSLFD
ncbi:MAG: orotate phosphoribosyltransferase [Mycoplasmatales bacterium]